jgi:hypothetical protein
MKDFDWQKALLLMFFGPVLFTLCAYWVWYGFDRLLP